MEPQTIIARRIAREQLDRPDLVLREPKVASDAYPPRRFPELGDHWDLEFIFFSSLLESELPRPAAWKELRFLDLTTTPKTAVARSHEDVLESAGLQFGSI